MIKYQRERAHQVYTELVPLFKMHWEEVALFKDFPLEPNFDQYIALEEMDMLRVYTIRKELPIPSQLGKYAYTAVGYCVFFINHHMHYQTMKVASQDVLFIHPKMRGIGKEFLLWCEEQLKADRVNVITQHTKSHTRVGEMLESIGYQFMDKIHTKRIG